MCCRPWSGWSIRSLMSSFPVTDGAPIEPTAWRPQDCPAEPGVRPRALALARGRVRSIACGQRREQRRDMDFAQPSAAPRQGAIRLEETPSIDNRRRDALLAAGPRYAFALAGTRRIDSIMFERPRLPVITEPQSSRLRFPSVHRWSAVRSSVIDALPVLDRMSPSGSA